MLRPVVAHGVSPGAQRRLGAGRPAAARAGRADRAVVALVHGAFAHRRKALAGSLALAPGAPERTSASGRGRRSWRSGTRPTCGPSASRRQQFAALAERLAREVARARPRARSTSACSSGRPGADGRHELVTVFESVSLADELELDGALQRRGRGHLPGRRGRRTSSTRPWPGCAPAAGTGRRCGCRSSSGSRWPGAWEAARLTPRRRSGWPPRSRPVALATLEASPRRSAPMSQPARARAVSRHRGGGDRRAAARRWPRTPM